MSVVKYCGLALLTVAVAMIIAELKPNISKLVTLTACTGFVCAAAATLYPSYKYFSTLIEDTALSEYSSTLIKALGVALAVEISADVCRDAGEGGLASKLEMIGKAELLLLALPLIGELIERARSLLL